MDSHQLPGDPYAREVIEEQLRDADREMRKLSDLAFVFLNATNGDRAAAEHLLDDSIELLCEGGIFCTWRYRIVLEAIREGL